MNINEAAEDIIAKILADKDPFASPIVVTHNTRIAQWFKSYFLKNHSEVMLNVKFMTLSVFLNEIVNPQYEAVIMDRAMLRDYILKELTSGNYPQINYMYASPGVFNGINLFELAGKLAELFTSYELDGLDIQKISNWQKDLYKAVMDRAAKDHAYTTAGLYAIKKSTNLIPSLQTPVYILNNSYISALFSDILQSAGDAAGAELIRYDVNGDRFERSGSLEANADPNAVANADENAVVNADETPEANADANAVANPAVNSEAKQGENTVNQQASCKLLAAPSILREVEAIHSIICKTLIKDRDVKLSDFVVYAPNITDYAPAIRRVFQQSSPFPSIDVIIAGESKLRVDMLNGLTTLQEIADKGYYTRLDLYNLLKNPLVQWARNIEKDDVENCMEAIIATNSYRNSEEMEDWKDLKRRLLISRLVSDSNEMENLVKLGDQEYLPHKSMNLDERTMNLLIDVIDDLQEWCDLFEQIKSNLAPSGLIGEKEQSAASSVDPEVTTEETSSADLKEETESPIRRFYNQLSDHLDRFFSVTNSVDEETNYYYAKVCNELDRITEMEIPMPLITLWRILLSAPSQHSSSPADVFSQGVTFLNLTADEIVSAKHCFVMGLSSKAFPRIDRKSELDLTDNSVEHKTNQELDRISIENLCSGCENVTFSYVKYDLKKDEEFFPSSLIPKNAGKEILIPLDETRDYAELFTSREFRNKEYYLRLCGKWNEENADEVAVQSESVTQAEDAVTENVDVPAVQSESEPQANADEAAVSDENTGNIVNPEEKQIDITLSEIKKFLDNPFVYKMNKIFKSDDDQDDQIRDEYEHLKLDPLEEYSIAESMILKSAFATDPNMEKAVLNKDFHLKKSVIQGELGETILENLWDKTGETITELRGDISVPADDLSGENLDTTGELTAADSEPALIRKGYDPEPRTLKSLELKCPEAHGTLTCNVEHIEVFSKEDDKDLYYIQPKVYKDEIKDYDYYPTYVYSLMDVAGRLGESMTEETTYTVHLLHLTGRENTKQSLEITYELTPTKAKETINGIYSLMVDYEHNQYMDKEFLSDKNDAIPGFVEIKGKIEGFYGHNSWKYYNDQSLFDPFHDFGYKEELFEQDFKNTRDEIRKYLIFKDYSKKDESKKAGSNKAESPKNQSKTAGSGNIETKSSGKRNTKNKGEAAK